MCSGRTLFILRSISYSVCFLSAVLGGPACWLGTEEEEDVLMLFSPFAAPDAAGPALGAWVQHPRLLSPSAALRLFLSLFKIGLLVKITGNLRSSLFKAKLRAVLPGSQQLLYLPVFCSPRQSPGRLGVPRSGRLRDSRFLFCCWVFFWGGLGG